MKPSLETAFLADRKSLDNRKSDLRTFATFVGLGGNPIEAVEGYLFRRELSQENAEDRVNAYLRHLLAEGLSPATVNRHLCSLRTFVKFAKALGLCEWILDIPSLDAKKWKDIKGLGDLTFRKISAFLEPLACLKGRRDLALIRLLHDLRLRRSEVCGINYPECYDVFEQKIAVEGRWVPLTLGAIDAVELWLEERKTALRGASLPTQGPMFVRLNHKLDEAFETASLPPNQTLEALRLVPADVYRLVRHLTKRSRQDG